MMNNKLHVPTVLVVDDNKINTEIIISMLKNKYNLRE